jgi:hypothetical protein
LAKKKTSSALGIWSCDWNCYHPKIAQCHSQWALNPQALSFLFAWTFPLFHLN